MEMDCHVINSCFRRFAGHVIQIVLKQYHVIFINLVGFGFENRACSVNLVVE